MNFNEYQKKAHKTAQYPTNISLAIRDDTAYVLSGSVYSQKSLSWIYPALGLAGESGELLNKLKKVIRDQNGILPENDISPYPTGLSLDIAPRKLITKQSIIDELGDGIWYHSEMATALNIEFNEIAQRNIDKLSLRKVNNTIKGSGDNR